MGLGIVVVRLHVGMVGKLILRNVMMGIRIMGMVVVLIVRLKMDGHVEEVHQ